MRKLPLVGLVAAAAMLTTVGSAPRDAFGDHREPVTPPLQVVLADSKPDNDGNAIEANGDGIPATARNPIAIGEKDPDGKPRWRIPVCSVPAYRSAVTAAVTVWNTGAGVPIFEMLTSSPTVSYDAKGEVDSINSVDCPEPDDTEKAVEKYVASVVVIENRDPLEQDSTRFATMPTMNAKYHARTGRNRIYVTDSPYKRLNNDSRIAFFVHELGHTLGFSHPYEPMYYAVPGYSNPSKSPRPLPATRVPGSIPDHR